MYDLASCLSTNVTVDTQQSMQELGDLNTALKIENARNLSACFGEEGIGSGRGLKAALCGAATMRPNGTRTLRGLDNQQIERFRESLLW